MVVPKLYLANIETSEIHGRMDLSIRVVLTDIQINVTNLLIFPMHLNPYLRSTLNSPIPSSFIASVCACAVSCFAPLFKLSESSHAKLSLWENVHPRIIKSDGKIEIDHTRRLH